MSIISTFRTTITRTSAKRIPRQISENPVRPHNENAMDSGNTSVSLSTTTSNSNGRPTISSMANIPTSLNPTDILAFMKELPTYDRIPNQLQDFIINVEKVTTLINGIDQTPYSSLLLRDIRN